MLAEKYFKQEQVSLTPSIYSVSYSTEMNQYVFEDMNTLFMSFVDHVMVTSVLAPYLDMKSISELVNNVHSYKPTIVDLINGKVLVKRPKMVSEDKIVGLMLSPGFVEYAQSIRDVETDMSHDELMWEYYESSL